jgi:ATP-dependent DNA helicase RecG
MTYQDIEALTIKKEGNSLEFKESTGQLDRSMETLCAFLNGEGGTILYGVKDDGKIIGQTVSDSTKRSIAEAVNRIEPFVDLEITYVAIPGTEKYVIVIFVEEQRFMRPFTYKGRAYQRIESTTTVMPQERYNHLLMERGGKYGWEAMINPDLKIADLDENAILGAVREGIRNGRLPETTIREEIPVILKKFRLLNDGKLNNAAAVLFGKELYDYPQCLLRMARFKGTTKEEFIDNQRAEGNIYELLDAAMAFIFKHLSLSGTTEGLEREEHLTIPYKAIREGVVNSLCHRQLRTPGGSVGIAIYDDRVEIENPGTFPRDWDMEKMKSEHCSEPQNPLIANVLYRRKLLESWGRGISLMTKECQKANLPEPEFELSNGFVKLIFRYGEDNRISTVQVPHKYHISTIQVQTLLNVIEYSTYSVKEMMELLGLKNRSYFSKEYLRPAIEIGVLEPIFPEQLRSPKQKYRLTEKGKSLIKKG